MDQFETEVDYWEYQYENIRCVYNDEVRTFYVEVWRFGLTPAIYLPCLIDNIPITLIIK